MKGDAAADVLEIVRELPASPERVWRALTESDELVRWWGVEGEWKMAKADVDSRVGGRYRLEFRHANGGGAVVSGVYRALEPPHRIVKTWTNSMYPDVENVVEFRLEPHGTGTRLTLRHAGLAGRPDLAKDYDSGWAHVLAMLAAWVVAVAAPRVIGSDDSR